MRQTIIRAACRSIEGRDSTKARRCARADATIEHRLAIGLTGESVVSKPLIKLCMEQNDLSGDAIATERLQLFLIIYHDDFRSYSLVRRRYAAPVRGEHDFLRGASGHARILRQCSRLFAAHPMRHHYFLELHFETKFTELSSDVFNCLLRLSRTTQTRSDVVREMSELAISVITLQRRLLNSLDLSDKLRRVLY